MTKKKYKVWDENKWNAEKWVDSRLEQLIHQASQSHGRFRLYTYKITTPIPPYLASQQSNYSMVETVQRRRFSKEIAEELITTHGAFAHLYALEKIEGYSSGELKGLWRDVLTWLDELGGDDGSGDKREDNPRPRSEQTDSTDINR